ncbi:PQQ-binding-like beta-propeller repeat protein [Abditibacterium utsteinense]|nr:PQQ-binding-like beta-propeller repeat protein [Abditibacterium utsteinense]
MAVWLFCFAKSARADFSFVHVTDSHVGASDKAGSNAAKDGEMYREISALTPRPAFAIHTGDACEVGTPQEYEFHRKALQNLQIPAYVAPGNHDVRWNPQGKEGFEKGTNQPLFQSWDYQNVHFIVLDSTVLLQHWGHFDKAMLDWLRLDLQKIGTARPVVIGFHHWMGRDAVQIDNEAELLQIAAPYNVVLWLQGHGHSDIAWNINGAPAIMAKGLYQGSYHLIEVSATRLRVLRRTLGNKAPTQEIASISLQRTAPPLWNANVQLQNAQLKIEVARGDLTPDAKLSFRVDAGKYAPLEARDDFGWKAEVSASQLIAGEHNVEVRAVLPDGRTYRRDAAFSSRAAGSPAPVWEAFVGGAVQSKLVERNGALYVSTMSGDLVCLDAKTGFQRWKFGTKGSVFSTPFVTSEAVIFGSADHWIYALDAKNGRLKWKTETKGAVFGGAALARGVVCIASVDTQIYGIDARSGQRLWKARGEGMFQSQIATDGQRFFVGGWDNTFRALDVVSGREVWNRKFGKSFYFSPAIGSPVAGNGQVFVTSNDGFLHAMEAATGKVQWEVLGPALGYSGPLLHGGQIYNASLTDNGMVHSYDAKSGAQNWESPTGSVIYDSSCAWGETQSGGAVYVGSVSGVFSALRARDGQLLWQYHLAPGHLLASPATDAERVYIASQNGFVVAFPLQ